MLNFVDELGYRILMGIANRISGRTALVLAFLLYAGGGLALPLALDWSVLGLVLANALGTALAGLVFVAWLAVQVDARDLRHLVEWTTDLRRLDAPEFEWLVAELFRREGWKVRKTGLPDRPDGNIDLDMVRDGQRAIVQCKCWARKPVGVNEVRAFGGTLKREGLLRKGAGIFVTLSRFGEQTRTEAESMGIALIDGRELFWRIHKVRRPEPCPVCQKPMKLDHSVHGWWFRCTTPGCKGKRHLDSDPGRAVNLVTQPS